MKSVVSVALVEVSEDSAGNLYLINHDGPDVLLQAADLDLLERRLKSRRETGLYKHRGRTGSW